MTELFDVKDLLTVATADQAEINTKGYFGDNLSTLIEKVKLGRVEILADILPDVTYCFQSNNNLHHAFFLPIDKVEKPYRALESFEELFDFLMPNCDTRFVYGVDGKKIDFNQYEQAKVLIGTKILLKDKITKRIRVMVIQSVEFSSDSSDSSNVYLNCFSLNELFGQFEIQINNEWVPFGIKK